MAYSVLVEHTMSILRVFECTKHLLEVITRCGDMKRRRVGNDARCQCGARMHREASSVGSAGPDDGSTRVVNSVLSLIVSVWRNIDVDDVAMRKRCPPRTYSGNAKTPFRSSLQRRHLNLKQRLHLLGRLKVSCWPLNSQ